MSDSSIYLLHYQKHTHIVIFINFIHLNCLYYKAYLVAYFYGYYEHNLIFINWILTDAMLVSGIVTID